MTPDSPTTNLAAELPDGVLVRSPLIFLTAKTEMLGVAGVKMDNNENVVQVSCLIEGEPHILMMDAADFADLVLTGCEQMSHLGYTGFAMMWNMGKKFFAQHGHGKLRTEESGVVAPLVYVDQFPEVDS